MLIAGGSLEGGVTSDGLMFEVGSLRGAADDDTDVEGSTAWSTFDEVATLVFPIGAALSRACSSYPMLTGSTDPLLGTNSSDEFDD